MNESMYMPKERRLFARTQLQMNLHGIRLDPDGGDMVDSLYMLDISRGGMGAMSDRSFYKGQRVMLALPAMGPVRRRNVSATIVRCRHDSEGYRIGMSFDSVSAAAIYGHEEPSVAAA